MKLTISKIKEIIKENLTESQIDLLLEGDGDIEDLTKKCSEEPGGACFDLAVKYYEGKDVEKSDRKALNFFKKGCGRWITPMGETERKWEPTDWNRRTPHPRAPINTGVSCLNAGIMYEKGQGAPWDNRKALFYYKKAEAAANPDGTKSIKRIKRKMRRPEQKPGEVSMEDKVERWLDPKYDKEGNPIPPTPVKGRCPDKPCPEGQICEEDGDDLKCVDGKDFCDLGPDRRSSGGRFKSFSVKDAYFREVMSFLDCTAGVPVGVLDDWEETSFPNITTHLKCASGDEALKWIFDKYNIKYTHSAQTKGIYVVGTDSWKPGTDIRRISDLHTEECQGYRANPFEEEKEPEEKTEKEPEEKTEKEEWPIVLPNGRRCKPTKDPGKLECEDPHETGENLGPWKDVPVNPGDIGTGRLPGEEPGPHQWKIPGETSVPLRRLVVGPSRRVCSQPCGSPPSYDLLYCLAQYHSNTKEVNKNIDAIKKKLQGKLPRKKQNLMPCPGAALPGGDEPLCDYGEEEYGYEYITKILQHAGYGVPAGSWPAVGKNRRRLGGTHDWPTKPIPMEKWKYHGPRPCPWEKQTRPKIEPTTKQKRRTPEPAPKQKKPSDTRKSIPPANPNANYVISFLVKPGYGFYQILRDMGLLKGRTRKQRRALIKKLRIAFEGRMITTKDIVHLDAEGNLTVEKPHGCVLKRPLEKNSQGWYICADKQPVRENIDFSSFPEYQNFFENWKEHLNKE